VPISNPPFVRQRAGIADGRAGGRALLDHLVGAREQYPGHCQAKRLRSLEIDDQLELGRVLHRHVGRLLALEDAAHRLADLAVQSREAGPIAHQAASFDIFAPGVTRGQRMARRERDQLSAPGVEEWIGADDERL
jgi:hypothetical protein